MSSSSLPAEALYGENALPHVDGESAHGMATLAEWADAFPGFENEMQGVTTGTDANGMSYRGVYCVTES